MQTLLDTYVTSTLIEYSTAADATQHMHRTSFWQCVAVIIFILIITAIKLLDN